VPAVLEQAPLGVHVVSVNGVVHLLVQLYFFPPIVRVQFPAVQVSVPFTLSAAASATGKASNVIDASAAAMHLVFMAKPSA